MSGEFPTVFPILETERLILREWQDTDAHALFQMFGDENVVRFTPIVAHTDVTRTQGTVGRFRDRFTNKHGIVWAITRKDTGDVIGETGVHEIVAAHYRVAIGYSLNATHWGNGFATEAVTRIIRYLFEEFPMFEVNRIEAQVDPANAASIRVMEKLGFIREAHLREAEFEKERFVDSYLFGLLKASVFY